MQQSISERNGIPLGFTLLHSSSYGPIDGQGCRNMLSYWTYVRHSVIRTQHLLCLTVIKEANSSVAVAFFLPVRAKDLSAPL